MSVAWWGALLGATAGIGVVLVVTRAMALRRGSMAERVLHYVHVAPLPGHERRPGFAPTGAAVGLAGPWVSALAGAVDRWVGGGAAVQRRLVRAGTGQDVQEFRVRQVVWGLWSGAAVAVLGTWANWSDPSSWPVVAVGALVGFVGGFLWCDHRLSVTVTTRERQVVEEFPIVAELLALAVAAGEGPVQALSRVVARTSGPLSHELGAVLAEVRTGRGLAEAFDDWSTRTGLPVVSRFARSVAVSVERGTPLADVLHAQVGDVREANRRELIESAARREVAMMVPVVFLVLPTVIVFALCSKRASRKIGSWGTRCLGVRHDAPSDERLDQLHAVV